MSLFLNLFYFSSISTSDLKSTHPALSDPAPDPPKKPHGEEVKKEKLSKKILNLPSCERKAAQSNVFRHLEMSVTYFFVLFVRKRLFSENRLYLSKINDFCYSQRLLGPSGGTFGRSWVSLGRSCAALGRPWPAFGCS